MKTMQTNYIKNFECNPNFCDAYCCKNRIIFVDEKTASKLKHIKPPIKSKEIIQHIKNNAISFENKSCPLLDDDTLLCSLAKDYNEEYVPALCDTYPYYYTAFNEIFTMTFSLTCPVCCNIVLKQKEPIEIVLEDLNVNKLRVVRQFNLPKSNLLFFAQKYGAVILQDKSFTLDERLGLLEKYLLDLENFSKTNLDDIFKFSDEFLKGMKSEAKKLPPMNNRAYLTRMTFILFRLFSKDGVAPDSKSINLTQCAQKLLGISDEDQSPDFEQNLSLFEDKFLPAKKAFENEFQDEITNMLTHVFLMNHTPILPQNLSFSHSINYLRLQYEYMTFILISSYYIYEERFDFTFFCQTVTALSKMFEDDARIMNFFKALSTGI